MSNFRAYAQLFRLPNVFTAMADIGLGIVVSYALPSEFLLSKIVYLLGASSCLYCSGMVWNDFFDIEQDRRERPFRPIPSGRIRRAEAGWLGAGLMALGLAFAWLAGREAGIIAVALAAMILLYDAWLKRTWAGPLAMGSCRALNVLLGLTLLSGSGWPWTFRLHLALVVGVYIVGVTWFARTEGRLSNQSSLLGASCVMLAALLLALAVPLWFPPGTSSVLFPFMLVGLGFAVGIPAQKAVARPAPQLVQATVKRAIMGLVLLDAVLATAAAGVLGLIVLVLLPPALYLGRWIYST